MVGAAMVFEREVYCGNINVQHRQGTLTEVRRTRGLVDFGAAMGAWTIPLAALAVVPPAR
jgi:hypothetical protein